MRLTSLVLASPFLLSSLLIVVVKGQECATDGACDSHIRCPIWAEEVSTDSELMKSEEATAKGGC